MSCVRCRPSRGPVSLRVSVTDRCQLRCSYCMPTDSVPWVPRRQILSFEDIVRFIRALKLHVGLSKVRITGGEPLLRRDIVNLVRMVAAERVADIALTTNGQILSEMAPALKQAGLRRVNVSLDSLDPATYATLTGGGDLHRTLRGIEAALNAGLTPVKLNVVVLRGLNEQGLTDLTRWAFERDCAVRFIELMPIGSARARFANLFVSTAEVRARLAEDFKLKPLETESAASSRDFLATDRQGRHGVVGFISSVTQPFCEGCRRLRLTSSGELINCLASNTGAPVRELLRSKAPDAERKLVRLVNAQLARKMPRVAFRTDAPMVSIGG